MDHDRLFKELLTTFFVEFLELFFPGLVEYLDRESVEFLDKEVFTDVTEGERHKVDLVVKARFREKPSFFLIHVETQAQPHADFARRMFSYFARLHEKHGLPVYSIVLFSYDAPQQAEPDEYRVAFPDLDVVDTYLRLTMAEEQVFQAELKRIEPHERERVMEIVTSWMEKGIEQGIERGAKQGKRYLVLRQLRKQLGSLGAEFEDRIAELSVEQLERLAEALLDFTAPSDLTIWLDAQVPQ